MNEFMKDLGSRWIKLFWDVVEGVCWWKSEELEAYYAIKHKTTWDDIDNCSQEERRNVCVYRKNGTVEFVGEIWRIIGHDLIAHCRIKYNAKK